MDWLKGAGITMGLWLAAELASELTAPLFRRAARLYAPPHGRYVLLATWVVAVGGFWSALHLDSTQPQVAIPLILALPALALVGTLVYRDQRRAARGLPPVRSTIPGRLGWPMRAGLALLAFGAAALATLALPLSGEGSWSDGLAFALVAIGAALAALLGRFPRWLLAVFDARERPSSSQPPAG